MIEASNTHLLLLAAFLFCAGLLIVIIKRNLVLMLVGIELMLNAANLNLITFQSRFNDSWDGQLFMLFVIVVAVCEAAVGIAIVIRVYRFYETSYPDQINQVKERD